MPRVAADRVGPHRRGRADQTVSCDAEVVDLGAEPVIVAAVVAGHRQPPRLADAALGAEIDGDGVLGPQRIGASPAAAGGTGCTD